MVHIGNIDSPDYIQLEALAINPRDNKRDWKVVQGQTADIISDRDLIDWLIARHDDLVGMIDLADATKYERGFLQAILLLLGMEAEDFQRI